MSGRDSPNRSNLWAQLQEESSSLRPIDVLVFALILCIGALQFFYIARARDFLGDDVFWADSARSLVDHGYYGINGFTETNMPPGLPLILALLRIAGVGSHAACLRTMVIFGALGFLASYELLRRQAPRGVAATICLLLISSRVYFDFVTRQVWPSCPYFFTTMCALLVARKLEQATHTRARIEWGALLTLLIAASLMIASVGIAFLGAMVMSICVVFFRNRPFAIARLKTYAPIFLVAIAVQGYWMLGRGHVDASAGIGVQEWPIPGFPRSYLAQLPLKAGWYPELGMATASDIGVRILKNAAEYSNLLSRMLFQRMPDLAWMSVLVAGPVLLATFGWSYAIWSTGGDLQDWYFAGFWFIYVLWPWSTETRFFLPAASLACLYMWGGGKALILLAKSRPRLLGIVCCPFAITFAGCSWLWMNGMGIASHLYNAGIEDEVSFMAWSLMTFLSIWMIWAGDRWLMPFVAFLRRYPQPISALGIRPLRILQLLGAIAVPSLIVLGLTIQVGNGSENRDPNSMTNHAGPDVEAAAWVRSNTDTNAVVMARLVSTISHYSERKVIWFPPSSNSQLLMEGILKHKVGFVIVVRREYSYYLPPDDDCFGPLLKIHPDLFRLVRQRPEFRVFQVVADANPLTPAPMARSGEGSVPPSTMHASTLQVSGKKYTQIGQHP